jgi:oxygen-independent coproporphyrinogen-3 oxidase
MNLGIYIHVPFCSRRCNYCHFITRLWDAELAERYWRAIVREMEAFSSSDGTPDQIDSIYFGGGTPSMVPAEHIVEILNACRRLFDVCNDCEISLEANPGTLSCTKIDAYAAAGINRVSLGAQSFHDTELRAISRSHTAVEILAAARALKAGGLNNINLDLMLGLPHQSQASLRQSVEQATQLDPTHISLYMLDLDTDSPLKESLAQGQVRVPEDDELADWYGGCVASLSGHGLMQYEISNFAKAGHQCRHNMKYWLRLPVMGFGVGSHSFDGRRRFANTLDLEVYLQRTESGDSPVVWSEVITPDGQIEESFFLGLRLQQGVNWKDLCRAYGEERLSRYEASLREMADKGLVEWRNSVIRLTPAGILLSNEVFEELIQ